jgi:hypothetical protein
MKPSAGNPKYQEDIPGDLSIACTNLIDFFLLDNLPTKTKIPPLA